MKANQTDHLPDSVAWSLAVFSPVVTTRAADFIALRTSAAGNGWSWQSNRNNPSTHSIYEQSRNPNQPAGINIPFEEKED